MLAETIQDFCIYEKKVKFTQAVTSSYKENVLSLGEKSLCRVVNSLRILVKEMRFQEKTLGTHCWLVVGMSRAYWDSGLSVCYVKITWIDSNLTFHKCWQSDEVMVTHTSVNSGRKLVMLHADGN